MKLTLEKLYPRHKLHSLGRNSFFNYLYRIYIRNFYFDSILPKRIGIEVTDKCNINCKRCPSGKVSTNSDISLEIVKKIADEVSDYRIPREFSLHKMGEPLLNTNLSEILTIIKLSNPNNKVFLATNGLLLSENYDILLSGKIDVVEISLSAARPDTFSKNKGFDGLGKLEKDVKELIRLRGNRHKNRLHIILQIIKTVDTLKEIDEFIQKWSSYPVKFNVTMEENWKGYYKNTYTDSWVENIERYPCHYLWVYPQINVDGGVSACPTDWDKKLIIGDIRRETLKSIWNNDKINKLRRLHINKEYGPCKDCNSWLIYPRAL